MTLILNAATLCSLNSLLQAAKKKMLRAYGVIWLLGVALHTHNCFLGLQRGSFTLAWGGVSALLGVACLWRGLQGRGGATGRGKTA